MSGFIIYILVSVFTPGPNNIFASVSTVKSGLKVTLRFMFGVLFGTFIIFLLTGLFNVYLYQHMAIINQIIGVVGGLFILYLALRMFLDRKDEEKLLIRGDRLFWTAIVLNFVNAKTIIFGLTVATYYLQMGFPADGMPWFSALMAVLCFVAVMVWGLFGKLFKAWLKQYRILFNIVMSVLLAYSGIIILVESLT